MSQRPISEQLVLRARRRLVARETSEEAQFHQATLASIDGRQSNERGIQRDHIEVFGIDPDVDVRQGHAMACSPLGRAVNASLIDEKAAHHMPRDGKEVRGCATARSAVPRVVDPVKYRTGPHLLAR